MTLKQAVCCEKFIGWCACNIGPMINAGMKVNEVAERCVQETYPAGDSPIDTNLIEKYIPLWRFFVG